jgi:hypothetical protein
MAARLSSIPSYSHRTRCHSLANTEHTGGLLALGPGLGKTLIMIAYDAQARGRDGETQIGRHGALCSGPSSLRILTSTHTGGNRSLFTRLRLSSETTTASDDPEKVRRFRHRDHTSADGLGFQVTIEDEPALLRRSARTGGQDHQTPSRTIFPPTPTHPPSRVTATPSHAKYLSESRCHHKASGRKPVCCKYYPDTFNALRKMIIRGYRRRCGQSLPITINTSVPLNVNDLAELQSILHAPR